MPVMSGTVHDEYNFVIAIDEYFESPRVPVTATQYEDSVKAQFGAKADKVLAEYPVASYPTAQLAWDAEGTDSLVCPQYEENKVLSPQVPVYAYEFNDQNIPSYFPKMPGFQPLAYHTGDIQFLFPLWHGGPLGIPHKLNAQQRTLSDELVAAWANFAWTGNPNGEGNSPWPQYIARSTQPSYYLSENVPELTTMTADEFASEHKCSFWKSL
jgi:para-nitrobenzyl esterase